MQEGIKVQFLGQFAVLDRDGFLFPELKGSQKNFELFRFLLAQKDQLFSPERIADSVWPEHDYQEPKKVVRTYIHRLRKFLEVQVNSGFSQPPFEIVSEGRGYKIRAADWVELDIAPFSCLCGEIQKESEAQRLLLLADRLLALYTGPFLEEYLSAAWVVRFQNKYIRGFCESGRKVLSFLTAEGMWDSVIWYGEKILEKYALDEAINILYMKALGQIGQKKKALEYYSYITRKIYQELSAPPSEDMKKLYQWLNGGEPGGEEAKKPAREGARLTQIVGQVMKEYISPVENNYAVAMIKVQANGGALAGQETMKALETALLQRLRQNDRFVIVDESTAFAVLVNANEGSFSRIAGRIKDIFYYTLGAPEIYTIEIQISMLNTVS